MDQVFNRASGSDNRVPIITPSTYSRRIASGSVKGRKKKGLGNHDERGQFRLGSMTAGRYSGSSTILKKGGISP